MKTRWGIIGCLMLCLGYLSACDDEDEHDTCVVGTHDGCQGGLVCEEVVDGEPACFAAVAIVGRVFDATSDEGIGGATVTALDANGAARTTVVTTEDDGSYSLPIFVARHGEGQPAKDSVTLRVSALGFQTFPMPPRTAIPIHLDTAVKQDKRWAVQNAATDVALIPLPSGATGLGAISGRVDIGGLEDASPGGVLVVADQGTTAVSTAVSDTNGDFTLFNVPQGATRVSGYRAGLNVTSTDVAMEGDLLEDLVLTATADGLATVTGSVAIVNAPGGSMTSVLLVVESTFDAVVKRGEAPAGLRAADVTGAFTIESVPPGKYVVLAAFENDNLVRDPDESIGGTDIVHIEVAGSQVDLAQSFKITEALAVVSPGAQDLEVITTSDPTFSWQDDSSEDGYELRVYNALGDLVHENTDVPRVTGSETVSQAWTGASLEPGMIYQFRVVSYHDDKGVSGGRTYISATEDLRGVFQYEP